MLWMVFRYSDFPKEYSVWAGMRARCEKLRDKSYKWYGGRGIKVCHRWDSFDNFMRDMGPRPSDLHSIDRHPDNDGDYKPSNCRWATRSQQEQNKRKVPRVFPSPRLVAVFSKLSHLAIARHFGISERDVRSWKIMPRSYRDEILALIGGRPMPRKTHRPRPKAKMPRPQKAKPTGGNAAGYEAVLAHFHVNGHRHGAKAALAKALGLKSRAVVDRWQRFGIPEKYAGPLFKLTGMRPEEIWPENYR